MGKSRRKVPIVGICADSDGKDKRLANRRLRRITKKMIKENKEVLPRMKDVSDPWDFNKDGKMYLNEKDRKTTWGKRALRK